MDRARLSRLLYPDHSPFETALWVSGWTFAVGYSIYNSFLASQAFKPQLAQYDLDLGWFSDRLKDTSDSEWKVFSNHASSLVPWLVIHFIGSRFLKKNNVKWIPAFYFILSAIQLYKTLGPKPVLYLLLQPAIFFLVHLLGCSILVWMCAIMFLMIGLIPGLDQAKAYLLDGQREYIHYLTSVTFCWVNSRCVSFCLDHIWEQVPKGQGLASKFLHLLAYCFYLPLATGGPLVNYLEFHNGITAEYKSWTWTRTRDSVLLLLRYAFWFLAAEIILHYFYFGALQMNPHIMKELDLWTLCGTGYSVGQFFHIKYVVFYGFPRAFVLADDIPAPPHPKCIGRIHLYSDMWRYFDNGLYLFMHKYIYEPIAKNRDSVIVRLLSSFVCFSFIYVWHGIQPHIMIWSALNNTGIIVENLAKLIHKNETYSKLEQKYLSPEGRRRFHSILGGPLFLMSILSNFYFFMGTTVGDIFVRNSLGTWPIGTPVLLFFMYCGAQTSIEAKNWEIRKKLKSHPID